MGAPTVLAALYEEQAIAAETPASESIATPLPEAQPDVDELPSANNRPAPLALVPDTHTSVSPSASSGRTSLTGRSVFTHVVQEGQTLWLIAQHYGLETEVLAELNELSPDAVLAVGQSIKVPAAAIAELPDKPELVASTPGYYGPIVSPVESADASLQAKQKSAQQRLAEKREDLRVSLNRRNPEVTTTQDSDVDAVPTPAATSPASLPEVPAAVETAPTSAAPGRAATVTPTPVEAPTVAVQPNAPAGKETATTPNPQQVARVMTYRVAPGDTLSAIARSHGVSKHQLVAVNRIDNPDLIKVNQTLVIPNEAGTPVASQPLRQPALFSTRAATPETEAPTVAARPFVTEPQVTQPTTTDTRLRYDYVENLRQEIVKLREKYRADAQAETATEAAPVAATESATVTLPTTTAAAPAATRVNERRNPQFKATDLQRAVPEARAQEAPISTKPAAPQTVAVAPVGSENYDPLLPSAIGKMVSPALPPIGSADQHLPGSPAHFDGYIWPARGVLTSGFGWRWGRMHKGIDIAGPVGTPILAAAPGKVTYSRWNSGGYGNLVEITHPDGSVTLYAHNSRLLVREGEQVSQGQKIAEMGSTGYSTGPHLHFEIHPAGRGAVNPMAFLPRSGR